VTCVYLETLVLNVSLSKQLLLLSNGILMDVFIGHLIRICADSMKILIVYCTKLALKGSFFLGGDYNINLLKHDVHTETQNFVNNLFANFSIPLISRPTRFTNSSATLIDNIVTNASHEDCVTGILITDISDHLPVFLCF